MPEINDPLSGPVIRTREAAPLQGQTVPFMTGLGGRATAATVGSLGFSILNPLVHTAIDGGPDNHLLDHEDAVAQLKALGPKFDPSVLPAGRVYQTTLDAIKDQQTVVNNASDAADRSSSAGGVSQFVAGLAGGMNDPLFLALGPLGRVAKGAGEVAGLAKGASVGVRAATGAAEGGAVMGGYTEAQKHLGTSPGDRDITSYEVLQQTGVGMVIGGAVKAAVGQRPLSPETTARLEGSDIVAKKQGISVDNVVSPTGAIGKFQIEPSTAKQYMGKDFDVSTLHDPAVNAHVNQVILDDLQKRFPDDMEAQAIAYNAGPGRAEKWIAAGRNDSVLPAETQKYVARLRTIRDQSPLAEAAALPPEVKTAAMTTAVAQVAEDSEVNVDPIIKNGLAEKAREMNEAGLQAAIHAGEQEKIDPFSSENREPVRNALNAPDISKVMELPQDIRVALLSEMFDWLHENGRHDLGDAIGDLSDAVERGGEAADHSLMVKKVDDILADGEHLPQFEAMAGYNNDNLAPDVLDTPRGQEILASIRELRDKERGVIYNPVVPEDAPPLADAIPKPGSAIANERLSADMLAQINETMKAPVPGEDAEMAEVTKQAADAATIAEHAHAMAFGEPEEGKPSGFKVVMADLEDEGKKDDELAKAVDAAVRCGAMKGLE